MDSIITVLLAYNQILLAQIYQLLVFKCQSWIVYPHHCRALWEIHGVKISNVMVSKYAKIAAALVAPFVDSYNYNPTNSNWLLIKPILKSKGFVMDAIKKSILGYQISDSRDTGPCILTMRMAFAKYKEFPGKALKFIADGYTAYKLAQQQFSLDNMDFDVTQVIGLTNDDPVSTEYQ